MIQAPSNYLPPDPSQQQQYAAAQQMLAQALLQQSQQPQDGNQSPGGGGFSPAQAMQMFQTMKGFQPYSMGGATVLSQDGGSPIGAGSFGAS